MKEFRGRLRRIDKIRRKGGAFEATGTLGSRAYVVRERRSFFRPLLITIAIGLCLKAALLMQIGTEDYQDRVDRLAQGDRVEAFGAFLMQADPATVWLSEKMREVFKTPV
ncbi:hypothetical protein [Actibacterium mucosum]|nr:hypothetical protein [Actibacterium mucosum]